MYMKCYDPMHPQLPPSPAASPPIAPFLFPNSLIFNFQVLEKIVSSAHRRKYDMCLSDHGLFHLT